MSRRSGHTPKSRDEKAAYVNYIKKLDYEPTKNEALDFNESSDKEPDYSIQQANKVNRLSPWERFQDHFEDNWVKWVITGIFLIISYFVVTSKVSINGLDIKSDQVNKSVDKIDTEVLKIKEINHQQDLKIQKNKINIDNIKDKNETKKGK